MNENCHSCRTSNDIDMNLGPVTKHENDVMSENFNIDVIFPINGQSGAIQKPDSGHIVCNTLMVNNSKLL